MRCGIKAKLARSLCCNIELNKKVLRIKRSWDEVEKILCSINCGKKCCCKKG